MTMPKRPRVFISYRQKISGSIARYINDRLQTMGLTVFFDADGIHLGDNWRATLEQNLLDSEYLIVILAPTTLESEWVRREIEFAIRHNKPIIPIFTDGLANLYGVDFNQYPEQIAPLSFIQGIEYNYKKPEPTFEALATRLNISAPSTLRFPNPSSSRKLPVRGLASALVVILGLVFAFLALFPEQIRTDWFRSIGLLPSLTAVPTIFTLPTITPPTMTPTLDDSPTAVTDYTQTATTAVTNATATPTASLTLTATKEPPTSTATLPLPTATLTTTMLPPTLTPTVTHTLLPPTRMLAPTAQPATTSGYPCAATIVDNTGSATILNQIHSEPIYASSAIASVRVGQAVSVLKKELEGSRTVWYWIGNEQGQAIGYLLEDYLRLSPSCPQ